MRFDWDNLTDPKGNLYHILEEHPEMQSSRRIETIFSTSSGDEDFYSSRRGREEFIVLEKTYQRRLYRIVFQLEQDLVRIKTAFPIKKRRS